MKIRSWLLSLSLLLLATAVGCQSAFSPLSKQHTLPPAQRLAEPGPAVGGPGPGVLGPGVSRRMISPVNHQAQIPSAMIPHPAGQSGSSQVLFSRPEGMEIRWDVSGVRKFDSPVKILPAVHEFPQGGIYFIKLTNIPGRAGVELYPTLEVAPPTPQTVTYLAHNAIPIEFTNEDFDEALSGNFVTKVIYLPDAKNQNPTSPKLQNAAIAGPDTLVSTRLDPRLDPIVEADRRGSILAILRMGNKDREAAGTTDQGVVPVAYKQASYRGKTGARGGPLPASPNGYIGTAPYVAGHSMPHYGMPMTGTPIGLVGPPHIPLGGKAGLRRHVMHNNTRMHFPKPNSQMSIHVKQKPGLSYPRAASKVRITEQHIQEIPRYRNPRGNRFMLQK